MKNRSVAAFKGLVSVSCPLRCSSEGFSARLCDVHVRVSGRVPVGLFLAAAAAGLLVLLLTPVLPSQKKCITSSSSPRLYVMVYMCVCESWERREEAVVSKIWTSTSWPISR